VESNEAANANGRATRRAGPELLGQLIDRHAAALELYAAGWCDCPEDVLQEVLIELAARQSVPEQIVSWLYRAVRNRAINAHRANCRRRRHEDEAARRRGAELIGWPGEWLDTRTAADALDVLPQELRETVVAHLWGGLTFRQIGVITDTSESTAHRRYQDALRQIRRLLTREPCIEENEK
jgi:RNA polymerase sigma factor (sigma-70 family)